MKFIAGVFGGGGANGAWQAGRLIALKEVGYEFDLLVGTSVGALNALAEACDITHLLEDLWTNLYPSHVINKNRITSVLFKEALFHLGMGSEPKSVHGLEPLRELLGDLFLGKECKIDYSCSVVVVGNNSSNRYMKYQIQKGQIINDTDLDMVWGSTAIPVIFEEVEVNGMKLFDGGILQSTPIRDTIRHYPTTNLVAIVCQPFGSLDVKLGKGLVGRTEWVLHAMLRGQFEGEWNGAHNWNEVIKQWDAVSPDKELIINDLPVKYIELDLHAPSRELGDLLDFDKSKTAFDFYDGYNSFKT